MYPRKARASILGLYGFNSKTEHQIRSTFPNLSVLAFHQVRQLRTMHSTVPQKPHIPAKAWEIAEVSADKDFFLYSCNIYAINITEFFAYSIFIGLIQVTLARQDIYSYMIIKDTDWAE